MARVTLVAFALLTGFFYVTGKPVDENGQQINRFADLAIPKVAEKIADETTSKQLISKQKKSLVHKNSVGSNKADNRRKRASAKRPDLPSRNPRRIAARTLETAKPALAQRSGAATKPIQLAKTDATQTFQQGRNKFTGGAAKPLGLSYQQRYVKSQKPVLGPRLTAVLVKRELRRVGCYRGNVTSNWDNSARAAITSFNTNTGSNLSNKAPVVSTLERLQQVTKTVCVEQPVIDRTIIASAGQPKAEFKTRTFKKPSKWRTNVRIRKAAYRPSTTLQTPRHTTRPRLAERYVAPPSRKLRKVKRTRRAKRLKRIRIAKKRKARRRTAVRSWKRTYRRKKFGFSNNGGSFTLNN